MPVLLALAFRIVTASLGFTLHVDGQNPLQVTLSGPAAELTPGVFRGSFSLNGSPTELPITGTVSRSGGEWQLPVVVRFTDVPQDWADRFNPDSFHYRLRGTVAGPTREWSGEHAWKDVDVRANRDTLGGFLTLENVALTHFTLFSSEAKAQLALWNPFRFPLRIAETEYTLSANGREVGEGATRGMILHPSQRNVLALPVEIDHAELISAAGQALLSGGEVTVRLTGRLVIRLKGGDVSVPLDLSGHLVNAS